MESYEQIDRKQKEYVKAANESLISLSDCGYRWWNYSVSHCSFTLLVGDASAQKGNIVIFLSACEFISGPVDGLNQHKLEVIFNCDRAKQRNSWKFIVQDVSAGFRAVAGVFEWRKNFDLLKRP